MTKNQKTMPSFETDLAKTLFEYVFGDTFKGVLTLDDIRGQGVTEVRVTFKDKNGRTHVLTPPQKYVPEPGAKCQWVLSTAQARIEPGDRLPGTRGDEYEEVPHEGCVWFVRSERNEVGEWIEKHRICTQYEGKEPPCPIGASVGEPLY